MAGSCFCKTGDIRMKNFLISALVLSLLIACGAPEQSKINESKIKSYSWSLVTTWPKNYPGLGMAPERFSTLVEEMSQGQLKVKVYGAGELVPAMGVFDAVSSGSVEMGHGGAYYWKGKVPAAQFFAGVPFGFTADEINAWVYRGGGLELWEELYKPFNMKPLPGGNTGTQMFGWFNKEINSLDDIKGLKMRFPGFGGEVFKRAGGVPVNIPGGELYTAMQTGTIDAVEWVGPYNDLAFGFQQVAKYYYYPGWHEPGSMLEFTINIEAWDSLPSHLQSIVSTAAKAVNQDLLNEYNASNNRALQDLIKNHNVQLRELPKDVINEFRSISEEILETSAANDPAVNKVYQSFKKFMAEVKSFNAIAGDAFIEARTNSDTDS